MAEVVNQEVEQLRARLAERDAQLAQRDSELAEARETLRAIREGEVDALVVSTPEGQRIFTLQSGDQTYRTIVEQMQEGAVTLLEDGQIAYSNRRFAEMVKRPLEEVIGSHFCDNLIESDRGCLQQLLRQMIDGAARADLTLQASDGTQVPVHVALGVVVLDAVTSISVVVTDLTERKRAEAVLASEQFVRRLIHEAPIGVAVVSRDLRYVLANPAYQAIADVPVVGRIIAEVFPPAVAEIAQRFVQQVLDSGRELEFREYEAPIRGRTWWNASGIPLRNATGDTEGVMILTQEVTQQKLAEERLRQSEQRYRTLFESMDEGFCIIEVLFDEDDKPIDYRFLEVNPSFEKHTGLVHAQGKRIRELAPNHEAHWFETYGRIVLTGQPVRFQDRAGALQRWFDVYAFRFGWPDQRQVAVLFRDITEKKRAEEELTAAKNSAERAKTVAEQANRAKDHFLAVLSHELRTPLTPVVMGVSMLQDRGDLDAGARETLEMIRRNVEMEARLIDDLLDMTRIARGKVELQRQLVELGTVIQRAVEVCKTDLEARMLHFGVDLGAAAPYWVEADVARLQQVFWNLLKNAIKFTPHGGRVAVRIRREGAHVVVEVSDSGIGMESEALSRVFNAFEQAERSITRQFGGLGLGLAISKALVEMHGGRIEAQSEGLGSGATFRVRLPLAVHAGQPEPPRPAEAPPRTVRPLRILLVEDHGVTAKMMRMVLAAEGHTVELAGDVATGLEMAGQTAFDLLISDLGLPDATGYDLMRELRARGQRLPGIAMSGYGQEEDIQRSYQVGFSAHLTKPASRERLVDAIAAAIV